MRKSNYPWLTALAASTVLAALGACAVDSNRGARSASLVGLWKEESRTVHAITLRNKDGTYRRKVVQQYDYARPPIAYQERGRWSLRGDEYIWSLEYVSTPLWKDEVGKEWQVKILSSDEERFRHLSTDEAVIDEHRIGVASDAAFDAAQVSPLVLSQSMGSYLNI